jgi:WD40 repeat protein
LVAVGQYNNRISIIEIKKKNEVGFIQEKDLVQSSYISNNSKYILLLVSSKTPELHLWSLETLELMNRFVGFKQQNFLLRCCLGGQDDAMISCGSEDGNLFIWHRNYNKPLKILKH